jgi:hypothetical protein
LAATVPDIDERIESQNGTSHSVRTECPVEAAPAPLLSAFKHQSQERRQTDIPASAPRPEYLQFLPTMAQCEHQLDIHLRPLRQKMSDGHARESAKHEPLPMVQPRQRIPNRSSLKFRVLLLLTS